MKSIMAILCSSITMSAIAAGGLTISTLPNEPEESNPVCRDATGKLTNCIPNSGVERRYLVPIVVDGDGIELGTVFSATRAIWTVLSDKGYLFDIIYRAGLISQPGPAYYDEIDCGGNGYPSELYSGYVFESPTYGVQTVYIPWDATKTPVEVASYRDTNWDCHNATFSTDMYIPIANDPAVTGVASRYVIGDIYTLPIRLKTP